MSQLGRSRGYGFLEVASHADALRILRWANNNKAVNKLLLMWWHEEINERIDLLKKGLKNQQSKETTSDILLLEQRLTEDHTHRGSILIEFAVENITVIRKREQRTTVDDARNDVSFLTTT